MDTVYEQLKNCRSFAIMGGTFDPIHYGHLVTAEVVKHRFGVDKVMFIPTGRPAHKEGKKVVDNEIRYKMTCMATKSNEDFVVSRIEIDRPGKTYSIDTVRALKEMFGPDKKFYFITGADAILDILKWRDPEELLRLCEFIAVTRPGYAKKDVLEQIATIAETYGGRINYYEVPSLDISSSDLRRRVKEGEPIKYLLPENVEKYIYDNGLYKEEE